MSPVPETIDFNDFVDSILGQCKTVMSAKKNDYAENNNRYSNFEESSKIAGISPEQSIIVLMGVKLARLRQLTVNNKEVKNESMDDSILDLINYALILGGYKKGLQ
jgi:hypothetical protein